MKSLKKLGVVALAIAMLASSVSAFACANDKFIAYDQIPNGDGLYNKIYKCPEKGAIITNGHAEKVEWKHAFYEADYPHREIEQLWLDDQPQGLTMFNGKYAPVNTKELPDFWESKAPYFVYNRVYSDFTGTFQPTNVLKTNYVTAPVAKDWNVVGFDKYVKEADGTVVDYSHVYGLYNDKINFDWNNLTDLAKVYWQAALADEDAFLAGNAHNAYAIFDHAINRVSWLELAGPDYVTGGINKFQPFAKIVEGSDPSWYDAELVSDNAITVDDSVMAHLGLNYQDKHVDVEWVTVGYELAAPYRYYQVLSLDGVLMDGREVEIKGYDVKKEEVVEVKTDFADEIHVIEKAKEITGYEYDDELSYVLTPFSTDVTKNVNEIFDVTVIDDWTREQVLAKYAMPTLTPDHEIRFVKVTTQPGKTRLPYIWRYAGGYANPKVEWKTAFAEAAKPYEIYEEKFVDGIPTGEYRSTGRYADDMPFVSTEIGQPRVLTVVLSDSVDASKLEWALIDSGYEFIIADNRLTVIVPADIYPGHYNQFEVRIDNIINSCEVNMHN